MVTRSQYGAPFTKGGIALKDDNVGGVPRRDQVNQIAPALSISTYQDRWFVVVMYLDSRIWLAAGVQSSNAHRTRRSMSPVIDSGTESGVATRIPDLSVKRRCRGSVVAL